MAANFPEAKGLVCEVAFCRLVSQTYSFRIGYCLRFISTPSNATMRWVTAMIEFQTKWALQAVEQFDADLHRCRNAETLTPRRSSTVILEALFKVFGQLLKPKLEVAKKQNAQYHV